MIDELVFFRNFVFHVVFQEICRPGWTTRKSVCKVSHHNRNLYSLAKKKKKSCTSDILQTYKNLSLPCYFKGTLRKILKYTSNNRKVSGCISHCKIVFYFKKSLLIISKGRLLGLYSPNMNYVFPSILIKWQTQDRKF